MLPTIIKFFFIILFNIYICAKILRLNTNFKINICIIALFLSIFNYYISIRIPTAPYAIIPLVIWILLSLITSKPQLSFIISSLGFVISYSLHAFSSLVVGLIAFKITPSFPYEVLALLSSLLQAFIIFNVFQLKRFNANPTIFLNTPLLNSATITCILFIYALIYARLNNSYSLIILAFILALAFLIYWWQAQITKSYRRSLELRELESLRTELQEKNTAMMKVMEENERVHFINHRDNGLLTTLDYATSSILEMDFSDEAAVKERCRELAAEIHRARDRRVSTVHTNEVALPRYQTKVSLLNLLLNRTSKRAFDEHVHFTVHINTELADFVPNAISDDDIVYLISDLLDNAFVATAKNNTRMIQLQFYKWNKQLVVEIADNGTPFEVDSILQMGIERRTTHADTGGTGVGLMTIWSIKEKYGATYHLDELEAATPFTKRISLTFDKKNRYSVRTYRKDEILSRSKRIDLQVYGQDEP